MKAIPLLNEHLEKNNYLYKKDLIDAYFLVPLHKAPKNMQGFYD